MNAVEIEEAVSQLAAAPFDAAAFPFAFLEAFGNKPTTIKALRSGASNKSDVPGGVLQRSNIHLAVCAPGEVSRTLAALKASPRTGAAKAKFILATDGATIEAEDLVEGGTLACEYARLGDNFGFFLPLAGITTVRQIRNNPIDIKATARLNRLYVELLKENPDWQSEARRHDLNQFMTRLIFCFFAEDTGIFLGEQLFTRTVEKMSDPTNTHDIIGELFRAMDLKREERAGAGLRPWADAFPYVNGGLFEGGKDVPRFSRIARSYLLHAGGLNWKEINPDIFGSMIQAVADDDERGELGMHYTSVPNILKVLNPLFLDDLRAQLEAAGDNPRKLLNLRKRLARIRVFDPACGSGNFLVIAYKEMRAIEHEIVNRRLKVLGDEARRQEQETSVIPLKNFYGIEIKDFACEIARLALLIAEFQSDVTMLGRGRACEIILPLKATGQIHCGNALRKDWLEVCPPPPQELEVEYDLGGPTGRLALDGNALNVAEPYETYVCGNPPYVGGKKQSTEQKSDIARVFGDWEQYRNLDYVCGFFLLACRYLRVARKAALVATNSINQGTHVPVLWPALYELGCEIEFAYEPFKWQNNARGNAGVSCTIIGLRMRAQNPKYICSVDARRSVKNVSPYLTEGDDIVVSASSTPLHSLSKMITGNAAYDGGHLFLDAEEADRLVSDYPDLREKVRPVSGTSEFIDGVNRYCLWFEDEDLELAASHPATAARLAGVREYRQAGGEVAVTLTATPHQFRYRNQCRSSQLLVPGVSSERRQYLTVGHLDRRFIITHLAHAIYDPTLIDFSVLSSRMHLAWVSAIGGKLETRLRYSSNLGWNTFPVPRLTDKHKADLTACAEAILLAREAYFPATIADMYDPDRMDADFPLVREAHERNDETLERIYIGRRFRNDTERLEKLFQLYTEMTAAEAANAPKVNGRRRKAGDADPIAT